LLNKGFKGVFLANGHFWIATRPDVKAKRQPWFDEQHDLDPNRLIFLDECGARADSI